MDRDETLINDAGTEKIKNSKYNLIISIIWFIPFILIFIYSIALYFLPGSYMGSDMLIYTLLAITAIQFLILLIKRTLRKSSEFKQYLNEHTEQIKKLYTARFVVMIIFPIISFVLSFYVFVFLLDQMYSGMWLLGGGMIICAILALIVTSALLHFIAYANTAKFKVDLSMSNYGPNSVIKSSAKIVWLTNIYAVLIMIPLLCFTIYNLSYSSVSTATYHNDNQQYETVSKFVSYTDKDKFMSNFLAAINSKDVNKTTTFYSPDQQGNLVLSNARWLIDLTKTNGEFVDYEFSEFSPCSIDKNGNLYLFVDLNQNRNSSTASSGTSMHIIKNASTKEFHAVARMANDNEYVDCPKN